ncbi:ABC transporter ATP-binding protein [Zavarzinia sp. CC-PAN008]|uniref:ABC transporter ATP-binding protein n=1 Tax=Zavarzinia sp. CC-PAN008 TaxID=3243332 RepID=UPI003F74A93F
MTNVLEVDDLAIAFPVPGGVVNAVKGVSFRVPAGKTVALVGESGSGKSVISQAVMGILPPPGRIVKGAIRLYDPVGGGPVVNLARLNPASATYRRIRGARVSIIFQEPMTSLSPLHTIGNQIGEALRLHRRVSGEEARALVVEMLRLTGFPKPEVQVDRYPFELSGGLRQRAMIAMALICRPSLLVADEPTTALDVTVQAQILKLMIDLQAELGMAILIITHDLGVVANVADEVVVMYRGRVMEAGPRDTIFRDAQHPYLKALLNAVPRFDMEPGERLVPLREIKADTSKLSFGPDRRPEKGKAAGPLVEVKGLTKRYLGRKSGFWSKSARDVHLAVDDVSFTIARGECLGLVGESGCGKTTTVKMLMRAVDPDEGSIRMVRNGRWDDVLALKGADLMTYRRTVQMVFQDPFSSLNPRMTVGEILMEPLAIHEIGTPAERRARAVELLTLVGLEERAMARYPHSFSGGQRQRIGIARALALGPELLVCDEPVSALDVSVQAQVLNLLKDLKTGLGLTYLFISHNLAVVDYLADRIAVMCAGRMVELAPRAELFRRPVHPYTQALLSAVPEPDPDRRLDLGALMEGRASDPTSWPAPFTIDATSQPRLVEVAPGHFVRTTAPDLALAS